MNNLDYEELTVKCCLKNQHKKTILSPMVNCITQNFICNWGPARGCTFVRMQSQKYSTNTYSYKENKRMFSKSQEKTKQNKTIEHSGNGKLPSDKAAMMVGK